MADSKQDKHEQALDLTEEALDALESGDDAKADKLLEAAKKLDVSAVKEVVQDLAEAERADGHDFQALDEDDLEEEDDGFEEEEDEEDEDEKAE